MNYAVIYPDLPCTHNEQGVYRQADVSPLKYSLRLRLRCRNIAKQNKNSYPSTLFQFQYQKTCVKLKTIKLHRFCFAGDY